MSVALFLLATALAAIAAWLLWRALSRGEVQGRVSGVVARAEAPASFWLLMAVNLLALVIFGGVGAVSLYRIFAPLTVPQRASAYYPTRALTQKASGLVMLRCTVTPAYGMKDCSVVSETPKGLGFAASALQISALDILPEKTRRQVRPGEQINLPIRFKLPDEKR